MKHDAGKDFKSGKGLLESGHLIGIKTHNIDINVRYCFVRGNSCPEQRTSNANYNVRVCLHKIVWVGKLLMLVVLGKLYLASNCSFH